MNEFALEYQNYLTEYASSPTGLRVDHLDASYAQQYKLNGPYLIVCEDFNFTDDIVNLHLYGPGFTKENSEKISSPYVLNRPMHQHSYFELMYVAKGEVIQKIEGKDYLYKKGQCCMLNHNVRHIEQPKENTLLYFLDISDRFFLETIHSDTRFDDYGHVAAYENAIYDFMQSDYKKKIFEKQYWDFSPIVDSDIVCDKLTGLYEALSKETINRQPGFVPMVQSLITRLISMILDTSLYECNKITLPGHREEYLFLRIQNLIAENNGRISRDELSNRLNYSGDYINKIVKKYTGMSLKNFERIFTLKEASRLLSQTNMKISQIMLELNFSNRSHFYQIFKEQYGMTPKEYRDNGAP